MIIRKLLAVALIAGSVAGCYQTGGGYGGGYGAGPREGTGTAVGAVTGGILGAAVGGGGGRSIAGGLLGAAAGGLLGNAIGRSLDEQARREAYLAEYRALESGAPGAPVAWRYEGDYGTVTPGPYYERPGYGRCREYAHTIYIDGRPETARGVACRQADGSWVPV